MAGGLLSISVNVLTTIRFESQDGPAQTVTLALNTVFFAMAAFGFAWLSLFIESRLRPLVSPLDIGPAIRMAKPRLAVLFLGSSTFTVFALVFLFVRV